MDRKLNIVRDIAKKKKIVNWETLSIATAKDKRFSITSPSGKKINFGLYPFSGEGAYIDHKNDKLRDAWRARHSKILKDGKPAYLDKESPEFYSYNLLWS